MEATSGENIDYGGKEPVEVILALATDDGVPSRGHRTNLFNPAFAKVGIFTGDH